jgi:hypothetical protein
MTPEQKETLRIELDTYMDENYSISGKSLEDTFFDFMVSKIEATEHDGRYSDLVNQIQQSEAKLEAARNFIGSQHLTADWLMFCAEETFKSLDK